jgi:hypothetical protein
MAILQGGADGIDKYVGRRMKEGLRANVRV